MAQRNNALGGQEEASAVFDATLEALIEKYEGVMYYHEIIGILHMHATQLTLEAHGVFEAIEEEEEEEDDDDWGNFLPDSE